MWFNPMIREKKIDKKLNIVLSEICPITLLLLYSKLAIQLFKNVKWN